MPAAAHRRSRWSLAALALAALGAAACEKMPLLAPTESTITLFATSNVLPANGSTEIVATVIEPAGTPVHNGTLVTFTTTLGRIEPQEARTSGGKVTVRLIADTQSGTATVRAFSGPAGSEPLEIRVGAAAAEQIRLTATPQTVPASGGVVEIVATVEGTGGARLRGVPVIFSTTAGTLSPRETDTNDLGQARTMLTTNRQATVTASAGTQEATIDVAANVRPTVSLSASPTAPTLGQPVTFTITVDAAANGATVQSVVLSLGDGTVRHLGPVAGTTSISHVYTSPGTYTATVTVTDTSGEQTPAVTVIHVGDPEPLALSLTFSPQSPSAGQPVTFTANASHPTFTITTYEWDPGTGSFGAPVNQNQIVNTFGVGTHTVRVRVTATGTGASIQSVAQVTFVVN